MLHEIDVLVQRKLIRKDSIDSTGASIDGKHNDSEESKEEIDDKDLCMICMNR